MAKWLGHQYCYELKVALTKGWTSKAILKLQLPNIVPQ